MGRVVNILVGGPDHLVPYTDFARLDGLWIGVDLGATRLIDHQIIPDIAVGDFDSSDDQQFKRVKELVSDVRFYPPEIKTEDTDTQLAIRIALELGADQIRLYGATGGRLDQYLANLYAVLMPQYRPALAKLAMIDRRNHITWYEPGTYQINRLPEMRYLAFVNLTPVTGLTLPDEKYQLHDYNATFPISWSSNEFVGNQAHFSFETGVMMVIQSRD